MRHFIALAIVLVFFFANPSRSQAQFASAGLIGQREAHQLGLHRAWITQVALDPTRDRLAHMQLDGPQLFVQTNKSLLQALDAETGGKMWTAQVGNREHPTSPPAVNEKLVAVTN